MCPAYQHRHSSPSTSIQPYNHHADTRTIFQQNQTKFQNDLACNHRGPGGVLYTGEVCEICFCRMADVPHDVVVPLHTSRSQSHLNPGSEIVRPDFLRRQNVRTVPAGNAGMSELGSLIFDADPNDINSVRSDPRRVIRMPSYQVMPLFAGANTISRMNDDPVRLDDMAFGGDFGTMRSNGTRRMKFDPPVKPLSMKSIEKKGIKGFLRRAFGRKRN